MGLYDAPLRAEGTDADVDPDADSDTDSDAGTDADGDSDADTDCDTGSDTGTGACNPLAEDGGGCDGGACCYFDALGESTCLPGGAGTQDVACDYSDDCACGYTCIGDEAFAICSRWCDVTEPLQTATNDCVCPAPAICAASIPDHGLACDTPSPCNEIAQTGCAEGEGCYLVRENGTTDCAVTYEYGGIRGDPCTYINDCAAGFSCYGGVESICSKFCDFEIGDSDCTDGDTCVDLGIRTPDGANQVGICTP